MAPCPPPCVQLFNCTLALCVCARTSTRNRYSIYQSQIHKCGTRRGMDTLVSAAGRERSDVADRSRMVISVRYITRDGGVSCLVWGCKLGFLVRGNKVIDREREGSLYPSFPRVLCDPITVVLPDILPCPSLPRSLRSFPFFFFFKSACDLMMQRRLFNTRLCSLKQVSIHSAFQFIRCHRGCQPRHL